MGGTSSIALTGLSMTLTRKGDSPWRDWQEVPKIIFVTSLRKCPGQCGRQVASGDITWILVISPDDYLVHRQNGPYVHNAGSIPPEAEGGTRELHFKEKP